MKQTFYIAAACIVSIILAGIVGYALHPATEIVYQPIVGAVGDTNSTRKIASCVLDLSTTTPTTATTTSAGCLYNSDSKDRIITSVEYYISNLGAMTGSAGTGVASTTWQLSTSTNVYTGSAAYLLYTTIATSTANGAVNGTLFVSTSTPGATATFNYRVWNTGTYLDLLANATSSAGAPVGTIVVNYFINN